MRFFPLFVSPTLFMHDEYEQLLSKLCVETPRGNIGRIYAFFEITNDVTSVFEAAKTAKYCGSDCEFLKNATSTASRTQHARFVVASKNASSETAIL